MTKRRVRVLIALAIGGAACAVFAYKFLPPGGTPPRREASHPVRARRPDLDALRSLPYASWTERRDNLAPGGVVRHDPARAHAGYNLYTNDADQVYLMDMAGTRRHTWTVPGGRQCEYALLVEDRHLAVVCEGQWLVKLDWQSTILWTLPAPVHHDVAMRAGVYLAPVFTKPRRFRGRRVQFDGIATVSTEGKLLRTWHSFEHLDALRSRHGPTRLDEPPAPDTQDGPPVDRSPERPLQDRRYDYYHLNAIEVLPDTPLGRRDPRFRAGNLLICLRNVNVLAVLDGSTFEILWHWGAGVLDFPHMPTMLPSGNILVFDNGRHRDFSRVLEIDPTTGETAWSYTADPPQAFHSRWRGSSQRLANGNTLICDSESGRAFEVTPSGEIVWEFLNPEVVDQRRKRIYRMIRYPMDMGGPDMAPHSPLRSGRPG